MIAFFYFIKGTNNFDLDCVREMTVRVTVSVMLDYHISKVNNGIINLLKWALSSEIDFPSYSCAIRSLWLEHVSKWKAHITKIKRYFNTSHQTLSVIVSVYYPAAAAVARRSHSGWMNGRFTVISVPQMFFYLPPWQPCGTPVALPSEKAQTDLLINIIKH